VASMVNSRTMLTASAGNSSVSVKCSLARLEIFIKHIPSLTLLPIVL